MEKVIDLLDWITQVKTIARLTQYPEIQFPQTKAEGIAYKPINDIPPLSTWDAVKIDYVKYLVLWWQIYMKLFKSILESRLQVKPCKSNSKDSLIW